MKTTVWVTDRFEGWHRWAAAPEAQAFLRDWHRHLFYVRLGVVVSGPDREIEFFALKLRLTEYLAAAYRGRKFESSCEMIATDLLVRFAAEFVEVSEDGENGATVLADPSLPATLQKRKCFVGIEAEGPNRGRRVLFVPGPVEPASALAAYQSARPVDRVYYGAGNCRALRLDTLTVLSTLPGVGLDVEVDCLAAAPPLPAGATVISWDQNDLGVVAYIKTVHSGRVVWEGPGGRYENSLADPLYNQDQDL